MVKSKANYILPRRVLSFWPNISMCLPFDICLVACVYSMFVKIPSVREWRHFRVLGLIVKCAFLSFFCRPRRGFMLQSDSWGSGSGGIRGGD